MAAATLGVMVGEPEGAEEGRLEEGLAVDLKVLGFRVGEEGARVVTPLDAALGDDDNTAVGTTLGVRVDVVDGTALGVRVDVAEGLEVGLRDLVGALVGSPVGMYVGSEVGPTEGKVLVGRRVVLTEGDLVGFAEGEREVGLTVASLLMLAMVGALVGVDTIGVAEGPFFVGFADGEGVVLVVGAKEITVVGKEVGTLLAIFAYGLSG